MVTAIGEALPETGITPEFIVGITGHRDIAAGDIERARVELRTLFQTVSDTFEYLPVRIATGLAEGADTLAAEVALELGLGVVAVLPMPREHYLQDFEGDAKTKLESLLADDGVRVFEIPLAEGRSAEEMSDQAARDEQYRLLADYLRRRSNLLVAVWDGVDAGLVGGTSDVVMRYLSDGRGETPNRIEREENANEGCGNIMAWVPVDRQSSTAGELPSGACYLISNANYDCFWQDNTLPQPILTRWKGFDGFYAERISDHGADLPAYGLSESGDTLQSGDPRGLDAEFVRADQIARFYQAQSHKLFALFGLLAAGMGLAFLIYAKLLASKVFLIVYIALFAAGFLGFRYSHRQHLHSKHLAFRALAETFRVQFFLILSGAGDGYNPRRILALTSVDQFRRFEWLQEAIRVAEPLVYFGHCTKSDALNVVQDRWIRDQLGYFEKKQHTLHRQHERLERIKVALLAGSVLGALALIFFKKTLVHLEMMGYDSKAWLVFFMGLLPLWVAVWELYQGKMATRELLWQYANQSRYFRAANREIEQANSLEAGQKIIRDLADKALIEIYMWSVHRYHREHEPPAAG
ncbi:hypothetical protein [Actibacterium pelagium]|uniref:SMODS and SLOG-associating 2TM effector domain-containing protein n=1 Tax=Actibacterium pelagium TaxID=2029103 RepID=A0A917AGA5_9RHOB|nr:hypothetical protein [Actibacterium pelagium]GGE48790.1 hypothetical protein GCM10011517_15840 [Actibacterium pelagium]